MNKPPIFIGCDFGQSQDYTAIVALERINVGDVFEYHLRHLDRLPLGTPYPDQVEKIKELILKLGGREVHLICDETGVGKPVLDMLRKEGLKPIPVTITGATNVTYDGVSWRVPKRDLVSTAQVLLQTKRLKISNQLPLAKTLTNELLNFKVTISQRGHDSYAADTASWREGKNDDTVLATALACWWAMRTTRKTKREHSSQHVGNMRFGSGRKQHRRNPKAPAGW
jgi:Terminase RNaseH-like domain